MGNEAQLHVQGLLGTETNEMALRVNPKQSYYVPIWQSHVIQMLGTFF